MLRLFRARGAADNLRLNAMSDGVFAIVMTLMVLEVKVPKVTHGELAQTLVESWPEFATVLLSFVVLGIYWVGHNNVFQHVLKHDRVMLWLNILFLLVVALVPYSAGMLIHYSETQLAYAIYAGTLAAGGVLLDLVWWYATYNRHLMCDTVTAELVRAFHFRILTGPALYLIAIGLSFVSLPVTKLILGLAIFYYLVPTMQDLLHHRQLSGPVETVQLK
ncbi:TMEM175 family protein [Candidatus Latescibacterota bacterium]